MAMMHSPLCVGVLISICLPTIWTVNPISRLCERSLSANVSSPFTTGSSIAIDMSDIEIINGSLEQHKFTWFNSKIYLGQYEWRINRIIAPPNSADRLPENFKIHFRHSDANRIFLDVRWVNVSKNYSQLKLTHSNTSIVGTYETGYCLNFTVSECFCNNSMLHALNGGRYGDIGMLNCKNQKADLFNSTNRTFAHRNTTCLQNGKWKGCGDVECRFPPSATINITKSKYFDGFKYYFIETVNVSCLVRKGNPEKFSVLFEGPGVFMNISDQSNLTSYQLALMASFNEKNISCSATNDHGRSGVSSLRLEVLYPPFIVLESLCQSQSLLKVSMVISSNPRLEKENVDLSIEDSLKNLSEPLNVAFSIKNRHDVKITFDSQISHPSNLSLILKMRYSAPPLGVFDSKILDISLCENVTTTETNFVSSILPGTTVAAICGGVASFLILGIVVSCVIIKRVKKDSVSGSEKGSPHGEGKVGNPFYENMNNMKMTNPNEKKTQKNTNERRFNSAEEETMKQPENPVYENLNNNSIGDSKEVDK